MMKIDILTLFPEMFEGPFAYSIVKRAQEKGAVNISIHNLRKWSVDSYQTVDDRPYGGGAGMVMKVDVLDRALSEIATPDSVILLTEASGTPYTQEEAVQLSKEAHLVIIAGHYEGVDYRVKEHLVNKSYSVGPYVLSGGELPAAVITDSVVRLLPGVLGNAESLDQESFNDGLLEYPHYTRPDSYKGWKVPEVLLSGNHKDIDAWRKSHQISVKK